MPYPIFEDHSCQILPTMVLLYLFLFLSFLFLIKLVITRQSPKSQDPVTKHPPGPWKLPVIGSMHHLLTSLPHRSLRDLARKHGPLMHLQLGEISTVVVSSPEAAREIMKAQDITFASRPRMMVIQILMYDGQDLIFAPYGEYWRQLRKACVLELLSPKRVQSFRSIREEEVFHFICSIFSMGASPINLSKMLCALANDMTARAVLGDKCKDQSAFFLALNDVVEAAAGFNLDDLFPSSALVSWTSGMKAKLKRSRRRLDQIFGSIVQERRERKAANMNSSTGEYVEDLLDVLLRIQDEGRITTDGIKAVIFDMFGAGSETSSTTLVWIMTELVRNPRAMKRAQSEVREFLGGKAPVTEADTEKLNYLKLVIKETLRLHPPVPLLLPRECRRTCQVLGYDIPEGTRVLVNVWAMGRDPKYWEDAEAFKPERFEGSEIDFKGANFEFLPFGAGRRICPGMLFGLANVELPLAQLLYYFDWILPGGAEPSDLDVAECSGVTTRRRSDLCLCAIPRIPCPTTCA